MKLSLNNSSFSVALSYFNDSEKSKSLTFFLPFFQALENSFVIKKNYNCGFFTKIVDLVEGGLYYAINEVRVVFDPLQNLRHIPFRLIFKFYNQNYTVILFYF